MNQTQLIGTNSIAAAKRPWKKESRIPRWLISWHVSGPLLAPKGFKAAKP